MKWENDNYKPSFTFACSSMMIDALRELDYKEQYKVCKAFYKLLKKGFHLDNLQFCYLFKECFEEIDPHDLDEGILRIKQCVNEMDNAISEIDYFDPMTFFQLEKELAKVINSHR